MKGARSLPVAAMAYEQAAINSSQDVGDHFTRNEGVPGSSPGVGFGDLQGFFCFGLRP
jgi:hypothetical protein